MDCRTVSKRLSLYIVGGVRRRLASRMAEHLSICERCARELQVHERVAAALKSLPEKRPPHDLWQRVERRVSEAIPIVRPRWTPSWRVAPGLAGAALVLTLAVSLFAHAPASLQAVSPSSARLSAKAANVFIYQHESMAGNELFADFAAVGAMVNLSGNARHLQTER